MYTMSKIILVFFIIELNILQNFAGGCFLAPKLEVYIIHYLPPNSEPLKLHCASKDNDLGNHTMYDANQEFHWRFCENIIPNTLFFCHLWWGSKDIAFDAFRSKLIEDDIDTYYWIAMSDGIYFSYDDKFPNYLMKKYDWNG
ncbi:hypothetical protein ACP275_06G190500 [Erythranthe tilingii]